MAAEHMTTCLPASAHRLLLSALGRDLPPPHLVYSVAERITNNVDLNISSHLSTVFYMSKERSRIKTPLIFDILGDLSAGQVYPAKA